MAILETLKKMAEKAPGLARPTSDRIEELVRIRKPNALKFEDDGIIPNNSRWPFVFYRGAVALPDDLDPAAVMEELFRQNGWGAVWRDGIYDYVHYHSRVHEVLGVARGKGTVRFGGNKGRTVQLKAGDVAVLPAGTASMFGCQFGLSGRRRLSAVGHIRRVHEKRRSSNGAKDDPQSRPPT